MKSSHRTECSATRSRKKRATQATGSLGEVRELGVYDLTASTNALTCGTGMLGRMPWPRLTT